MCVSSIALLVKLLPWLQIIFAVDNCANSIEYYVNNAFSKENRTENADRTQKLSENVQLEEIWYNYSHSAGV